MVPETSHRPVHPLYLYPLPDPCVTVLTRALSPHVRDCCYPQPPPAVTVLTAISTTSSETRLPRTIPTTIWLRLDSLSAEPEMRILEKVVTGKRGVKGAGGTEEGAKQRCCLQTGESRLGEAPC